MHVDELRKKYDQLCIECHSEAVRWTNDLVDAGYGIYCSKAFYFAVVASRNIYQSDLYKNVLNYLVVTRAWQTASVDVTVDSWALQKSLNVYAAKNQLSCKARLNTKFYFKGLIKVPVRFGRVLQKMFRIRRFAKKMTTTFEEVRSTTSAILVDTYVLNGALQKDGYSNRYFGSFFDFFTESEKRKTFLIPNFLPTSNLSKLSEEKKNYGQQLGIRFFCKEAYLSAGQYFWVFSSWVKSFFLAFTKTGPELFTLLQEELALKAFSEITFESLVSYAFMKKLRTANLSIDAFVNWNENHLYDRAFAKGHYDFKLPFPLNAYQGVVLDFEHDFYIVPTQREIEIGLFPKRLFLAGSELHQNLENILGPKIQPMPVFRLKSYLDKSVWQNHSEADKTVLVGLSLVPSVADEILIVATKLATIFRDYSFKIRCHPLLHRPLPKDIPNMVYDESKGVVQSLLSSQLLISAGSALVLEAALLSIPTLIVREKGMPVQNPLPPTLREKCSFVVTVDSDLESAMRKMFEVGRRKDDLRNSCSEPIFRAYVEGINRTNFEVLIGK